MSETWTVEAEELEASEPALTEVVESFLRLESAARSPKYRFGALPVVHCPLPYLDIQLHDDRGEPLREVPVTLDFPAGGGQKGTTDESGRVHFAGVDVDSSTLEVEIHRDWPEDADEPTYRARVHEKAAPSEEREATGEAAEDEVSLYPFPYADQGAYEELPEEPEEDLPHLTL